MKIVETSRLLLRPWRESDIDEVVRLWSDPLVVRYTWREPPTRERAEVEANRILQSWRDHGLGPWAAIEKTTGSWIGKLGPDVLEDWPDEHKIEVGWILHRACWGRGLATEGALASIHYAFEELRLEQVISVTVPDNWTSRRVMVKAGLNLQGTRLWRNAEIVWYAVSRAEWLDSHQLVSKQLLIRESTAQL
jgi:RimJ/RimL family protein N-acetyltransferase